MVVIWIPTGDAGWMLEAATPYDASHVGGGIRSLYELAAAVAATGREVELRGAVSLPSFRAVCAAAGAGVALPDEPRMPTASDTVIVPEGIADPEVHMRVAMSPARTILMVLGPPGLIGWPFTGDWSPPDPLTVAVEDVARPEHFRAAAELGYELWANSPGMQRAAERAGTPCRYVGNGVPGGYPAAPDEKDVQVAWLTGTRWAPFSRTITSELSRRGIACVGLPDSSHEEVLHLFGRARVVLHPLRVEGLSRIGCEARAMGAVPVVLDSNPFAVGLDEAGGALAVRAPAQMASAVCALLADPGRLARMSAVARATAREQVAWEPFVRRVGEALAAGDDDLVGARRRAHAIAHRDTLEPSAGEHTG